MEANNSISRNASNALDSWKVDYTQKDDSNVVEQLTDNIALIELILKDKEHLSENLDRLQELVASIKVLGAAAVCRHYQNSAYSPNITKFVTPEEAQDIQSINSGIIL